MAIRFNFTNGESVTLNPNDGTTFENALRNINENENGYIQITGTNDQNGTPIKTVIFNKHIVTIEET